MKVLMLTVDFPPHTLGGEGVFAGEIATQLAARGIELDVLAPFAPGAEEFDASLQARITRFHGARGNFVSRLLSLAIPARRAIHSFAGDLIYTLRPVPLPAGRCVVSHFHTTRRGEARAAWRAGHAMIAAANAVFVPFDRALAQRSTRVLAVSQAMKQDLERRSRPLQHFAAIPNGVDTTMFSVDGARRTPTGRLLYVGRLDPRKRVEDLLRAFALLAPSRQALRLSIVGQGREERRLRRLALHLGVEERVDFLAQIPHAEMPAVYRNHDVLVLPSAFEPFGLVVLEAMACGTPAVTSDACALLGQPTFPTGDVDGLCRTLGSLIDDPTQLAGASHMARRIAEKHDWRPVADSLIRQFEEALASPRPPHGG